MKTKIIIIICLIVGVLLGRSVFPKIKEVNVPRELTTEEAKSFRSLLIFTNELKTSSSIYTVDVNNDGIDELVFTPGGFSWDHTTSLLNSNLQPFCKHCSFYDHNGSVSFEDKLGDKNLEAVVLNDISSGKEETIYQFINGDYVSESLPSEQIPQPSVLPSPTPISNIEDCKNSCIDSFRKRSASCVGLISSSTGSYAACLGGATYNKNQCLLKCE